MSKINLELDIDISESNIVDPDYIIIKSGNNHNKVLIGTIKKIPIKTWYGKKTGKIEYVPMYFPELVMHAWPKIVMLDKIDITDKELVIHKILELFNLWMKFAIGKQPDNTVIISGS